MALSKGAAAGPKTLEDGLIRYREMRDFAITSEPAGAVRPRAAGRLKFVIQKHAARRLHYDLRLELNGVYKSWAIARGPSLEANEKRLAVHVEDHPIDYGDFEGIIPAGEYGGGTVMIWDRGFWEPEGDPGKGYAKGHLAFEIYGEKLKGRWHLIRTKPKPREKHEQWLLFKAEDEAAMTAAEGDILEAAPSSVASGRTLQEIAAEKAAIWSSKGSGLVKGGLSRVVKNVGGTTAKSKSKKPAAQADPFPGFVPPCLALLSPTAPEGVEWLHEIKFDGYRLMVLWQDKRVSLLTRSGLDWTARFPAIAEAFADFPAQSAIVDGEAVVEDENGVSSFSALQEALMDGRPAKAAILFAFDLLYLDGRDMRHLPLDERKAKLSALLTSQRHALRYSDHILADGASMASHACRLGLEGVISKRRSAPYRSGRHGEWLKIKCTNRQEFVIGGYTPSAVLRNAVGSVALGVYQGDKFVHAGRAGTGFSQKTAQALFKLLHPLASPASPFSSALSAEEKRGLIYVRPQFVAEIEFRGWTRDRHLRHAAFKGLREDKLPQEVTMEGETPDRMEDAPVAVTPAPQDLPATPALTNPKGPLKTTRSGAKDFQGVTLTHPDRVLWADQGLTKLDLAQFYESAASAILPHITGRPLSLVRCPGGSEKQCFFQKHAFGGLTDAVETVMVGAGDAKDETLVIRDLRGLISLVQANVLEIHPWGSPIDDVERPDRLIFDLDPGDGVNWSAMIAAALEVRERLLGFRAESFVKTSGGKGLHVVVPLAPKLGWDALKEFARSVAVSMEKDSPGKYLSVMTKKARTGKIFVDYLRNGRGATAVAAYSTRARPGAPVSTPVAWAELKPQLTPAAFDTASVPRRLRRLKSDPWDDFFSEPQTLEMSKPQPGSRPRLQG